MQEEEMCCCHKHKERSEKEYRDLINRLNRIEGKNGLDKETRAGKLYLF